MNGHRGSGFRVPEAGLVTITGGTGSDREGLRQRFEAAGLTIPIETTADAIERAPGGAAGVAGVVRLSPSDDEGTDAVPLSEDDAYLIVVGANVDVAAAYEAGASQVVPLAVADLPDGAVDRMVTAIRRRWASRSQLPYSTGPRQRHPPRPGNG